MGGMIPLCNALLVNSEQVPTGSVRCPALTDRDGNQIEKAILILKEQRIFSLEKYKLQVDPVERMERPKYQVSR
jgi:hypothetical protein